MSRNNNRNKIRAKEKVFEGKEKIISDSWYCNICGLWSKQCEENYLCPRNIIKTFPKITIEDKYNGCDIDYFTFSSVVKAMENYAELLHKAAHTEERKVIIEKFNFKKIKPNNI